MYKVIKFFTDLQDNNYPYEVGSAYPRKGYTPKEARINELSSANNRQKTPLIAYVKEEVKTSAKQETPVKKKGRPKKKED